MAKRKAIDISNEIGIYGGKDYLTALEEENKELKNEIQYLKDLLKIYGHEVK
ncbi:hypothetical protein [Cytobacillus oceanisediminis]|uniref:hypothetical protein n=1 Tax=Cytobacillus oceanisediminis TaxID=665099 RepID=UPI003735C1CA